MHKLKPIISILLTIVITLGLFPAAGIAAQSNEYTDPADVWLTANGRTNELDINSTITYETQLCNVCNRETIVMVYRVPEYTKSGETAYNRGVFYSDGTNYDGTETGNTDSGTPGVDAYYTGYHFTKSVCQTCGTINSVNATDLYGFSKNVYMINSCDNDFFLDFDNTAYEPYDEDCHITVLKKGQYCQFCKGTYARASESEEEHNFIETVDGQSGNSRFYVSGVCGDCGYASSKYVTAKAVVSSYYGTVDGRAHTVTVSDLSDDDVRVSIRYGEEAENCTYTSAPNYTEAGYYPVYYRITYTYGGEDIVENGVSYVWLLEEDDDDIVVVLPDEDEESHSHNFTYLETTAPSCTDLGYERWQCSGCGSLEKRNYTPALGHSYDEVEIREGSCTDGGLILHICKTCGDFYAETTPTGEHSYESRYIEPTCKSVGYTEHTCKVCGDSCITDILPLSEHSFEDFVKLPTCTDKGYTTHICSGCNLTTVTDYTDPTGHAWDEGREITASTCLGDGVLEYTCENCGETRLQALSHSGHNPGSEATCTEPQVCQDCGAILELPAGHSYEGSVTDPTCTSMGCTTYTCTLCGDSCVGDYTDKTEHSFEAAVTPPTCTAMGYTTYTCSDCGESYDSDYTDKAAHNYAEEVTSPTCTAMGFTVHTCADCGDSYTSDYTDILPHNYNKETVEPTCTEHGYSVYTCPDCGKEYIGDYMETTRHTYTSVVTLPTCTAMGYTTYTCTDCGDSYVADYTDKLPHSYSEIVTLPTCTEMGYTTYTCADCGDSRIGDYTDALGHDLQEEVTAPTCTSIGFSTFTCSRCGYSYIGNEQAKTEHSYAAETTAPACTAMGFTKYTCEDCGDSYIGDYTDAKGHNYKTEVTNSTCTSIGYTTYTCEDCGNTYIADETAKSAHDYEIAVTAPTCTELGYSTYTCRNCGDSYRADETAAAGHSPSDWIIDIPATIEQSGSKHKECTVCGTVLETAEIAQLTGQDNSDEDGNSTVGGYSVLITDKDNRPVFDSEISIDLNDNITIFLPEGRLLSAENTTTITVTHSESQQAAGGINIFVADTMNNAATGRTDENGQLTVPNTESSTGSSNGTVADDENTYVVVVTDKDGVLIPNCTVTVGDNYSINVKLPDGTAFDRDNRVTVTAVSEMGEPLCGLRVQLIGDGDHIENGYTNVNGQITLPMSDSDFTDEDGRGEVGEIDGDKIYDYIVTVSDETSMIKDALITLVTEDGAVLICLPKDKVIDYFNRITVKVSRSDGTPVENWKVTVYNKDGSGLRTELTDEEGIVIVPPLSESPITKPEPMPDTGEGTEPLPGVDPTPDTDNPGGTDEPSAEPDEPAPDLGDGSVVQNEKYKYRVYVWDNGGVITEFGLIKLQDDGSLVIELPENKILDAANKTYVRVINEDDGAAVKAVSVNVSDSKGGYASDVTNSEGIAVVPVSDSDITDIKGSAQVKDNEGTLYNVTVSTDQKGAVEGAGVNIAEGKITVTLPDGTTINYSDRTNVTVSDRDNAPVENMPVNVKDVSGGDRTENTDANGAAVVPPRNEYATDNAGEVSPDSEEATELSVKVEDENGGIENAVVIYGDNNEITVRLPEGKVLDRDNRIKVTVTNRESEPLEGISVTVNDNTGGTDTDTTNKGGYIVVPVTNTDTTDSSGGIVENDEDGVKTQYTVIAENDDGVIDGAVITVADGKISVTLPDTHTLTTSNRTKVTVLDKDLQPVKGVRVTVTDKNNRTATRTTDSDGEILVPVSSSGGGGGGSSSGGSSSGGGLVSSAAVTSAITHEAYIVGYPDGSFRPEGGMTRAEAAAIFARVLSEKKGETVSGSTLFTDIPEDAWYADSVAYLEKYRVLKGYPDGSFRGNENISRSEFVVICVRFFAQIDELPQGGTNKFVDVKSSHWAYEEIMAALAVDWIRGYADSTFRGENPITRAEAVTMVNRITDRSADKTYVDENAEKLTSFKDLNETHWVYYDVAEAANGHEATIAISGAETWEE